MSLIPLPLCLENKNNYNRSLFVAWKSEVSKQDHSLKKRVGLIDRLELNEMELTHDFSTRANAMEKK